ncbi:hypothetical protein WA538_001239, partial [Blastocystis sp. DL]
MSSNGNGLNYLLFLQFAIAYHHLHLPKAQHIIFNYLDKQQQGYITAAALLEYYQESVSKIQKIDNTLVLSAADLVRELYDMIHPKQQNKITLADIVRTSKADTIIKCIINSNALYSLEIAGGFNCTSFV